MKIYYKKNSKEITRIFDAGNFPLDDDSEMIEITKPENFDAFHYESILSLDLKLVKKSQSDIDDFEKEQKEFENKKRLQNEVKFLLEKTDWTILSDIDLTDASKENFKTYRKKIRDYSKTLASESDTLGNPFSFPSLPTEEFKP